MTAASATPLDPGRLRAAIAGGGWTGPVIVLDRVGSTNDELRALAAAGAADGTVLVAEEQTAGRGRRGRSWHSGRGLGLYLSTLSRAAGEARTLTRWTLGAAVAAAEACREWCPVELEIEWPNDLAWRGRKIGGILAEARTSGDRVEELILGVGINVAHAPGDFPPDLAALATSLGIATCGAPPARELLASAYLDRLAEIASLLGAGRWDPIASRFEHLSPTTRGAAVRVEAGSGEHGAFSGRTCGIDPQGALRVRREDGRMVAVRMADAVVRMEA